MQLAQSAQRSPGEGQPRRSVPRRVRRTLLGGRGQRVGNGEKVHLARVARRRLPGIHDPRRPGVQLQPVQRLELPLRAGLGVRFVARRQVVEMQDHLVMPRGVNAVVYAVETLGRGSAPLQVDIASEPAQGTVEGHGALRFQEPAEPRNLLRPQGRSRVETDDLPPVLQRAELHPPDDPAGQLLHGLRLARQQDHAVDAPEVWYGLAGGGSDLASLIRDLVRLLIHEVGVFIDPSSRPVLHLDDAHAGWTDGDHVDLVRLEPMRYRPGEVGQQYPVIVPGAERRLDSAPDVFEGRALALVGERPAVE